MSAAAPMLVSGWAVVSPLGRGRDVFVEAVASAADGGTVTDGRAVREVPGFDAVTALGRKGTRSMDRVTALAVSTVGDLVTAVPSLRGSEERPEAPRPGTALVLGTTTGSAQSMMDFSRSSFTGDKPYLVDPARFPNTVMNCAAGQCAIRYRLRGPNTTVGGGRAAGLLALNYARRLQRGGRAEQVLCGAAEEWSADRAWLHEQSLPAGGDVAATVFGEGCAMLLVEPASSGADAVAEVLAVEFGVLGDPADTRSALASVVRRALEHAEVGPGDVAVLAPGDGPGDSGVQERAALRDVLGDRPVRSVSCTGLLGDTAAAAATFQIAATLALAERDPSLHRRIAVVTAVDGTGVIGCGVLRLLPPARNDRSTP